MRLSVVVLFGRGRDPVALERALASVAAQSRAPDEVVLVLNGAEAPNVATADPGLRVVELRHDVGCPAGRNEGARAATGDVLVFVDDDGQLEQDALAAIDRALVRWPHMTALAGRVIDPRKATTPGPAPDEAETVHFSGGVFAIGRSAFLGCGGYCEYSLRQGEELDLALKLFKQGIRVRRVRDFVLFHPLRTREWASDESLLGTVNTVRIFWARLPIPAAAAGTLWKVLGHGLRLVREKRADRLVELVSRSVRAARVGSHERDALGWREYRSAWRLIHPGPLSLLRGLRSG